MVVIVNAFLSVDKREFVYSVNGLRAPGAAGQALYRCCTDVGQKRGEQKKRLFRTSRPVDMQDLFHSRAVFACRQGVCRIRTRLGMRRWHHVLPVDQAEVEQWLRQHPNTAVTDFVFFADRRAFASRRLFLL